VLSEGLERRKEVERLERTRVLGFADARDLVRDWRMRHSRTVNPLPPQSTLSKAWLSPVNEATYPETICMIYIIVQGEKMCKHLETGYPEQP
jgi:hypothetical protein